MPRRTIGCHRPSSRRISASKLSNGIALPSTAEQAATFTRRPKSSSLNDTYVTGASCDRFRHDHTLLTLFIHVVKHLLGISQAFCLDYLYMICEPFFRRVKKHAEAFFILLCGIQQNFAKKLDYMTKFQNFQKNVAFPSNFCYNISKFADSMHTHERLSAYPRRGNPTLAETFQVASPCDGKRASNHNP